MLTAAFPCSCGSMCSRLSVLTITVLSAADPLKLCHGLLTKINLLPLDMLIKITVHAMKLGNRF